MKSIITAILLTLFASTSLAAEVAGVQLDETIRVFNRDLKLNGTGVRSAMSVKIYVAALYLQQRSQDADEVLASKQPKRLLMVFKRNLKSTIVSNAFRDGIRNNSDEAELLILKPRIEQLERAVARLGEAKENDRLAIDFAADGSVDVVYNDKLEESISGPHFGPAMLKIWLGGVPVADDLKNGLLAGATYAPKAPKRKSAFDDIFDGFSP